MALELLERCRAARVIPVVRTRTTKSAATAVKWLHDAGLRIFEDDQGKMNRSPLEAGGSVLAVSQFTLYGDVRRGKRPSFDAAAPPGHARQLYEFFVNQIRALGLPCETGRFQSTMKVELVNDGPVTILLDSRKAF